MNTMRIIRYSLTAVVDFSLVAVFGLSGIAYLLIGSPTIKPKSKNDNIVILIHGSGVSDWQWAVTKMYLYLAKIPFHSVKYNYCQSIHISCDDVSDQIIDVSQKHNNNNVVLIGHSQGGLIARSIYNNNNFKSNMMFLLNTPQKGAPILNWLYPDPVVHKYPDSLNDMRPESQFISELPNENDIDDEFVHEIIGQNDFVGADNCIFFGKNVYKSWFSHYYSAVNPFLWFNYIIPKIRCRPHYYWPRD